MSINAYAISVGASVCAKNPGDAIGAFLPGMQKFKNAFSCQGAVVEGKTGKEIVGNFFEKIEALPSNLEYLAYFGHGDVGGLVDTCYGDANRKRLANLLAGKLRTNGSACFFSCLAGKQTAFTTKLAQDMGQTAWIYSHITAGHSFLNPDVSEIEPGGNFYQWFPYSQGDPLYSCWLDALRYTDLWIRFPMMYYHEVARELEAVRMLGTWTAGSGSGATTYKFSWERPNLQYESRDPMVRPLSGTISATKNKQTEVGEWSYDGDNVAINLPSGIQAWGPPKYISSGGKKAWACAHGGGNAVQTERTKPSKKLQG